MRKPLPLLPLNSSILPQNCEEFVARFPLFCEPKKHSRELRSYVDKLSLGLGLPVLKDRRPKLWGYTLSEDKVYIPIEKDLKYLAQARYMHNSKEYALDDILDWLENCNTQSPKVSIDAFYYILKSRPYFEEALKPFSERVKIIYELFRFTPSPEEEVFKRESSSEEAS